MNTPAFRSEVERLLALQETGLLARPAPPEFAAICEEARHRFGAAAAFVTLMDRDRQVLKAGTEEGETPRSQAICDHTIRSDEVFVVPDLSRDPRFSGFPSIAGAPHYRFYAGAPLIHLQGIRLGALCVLDTRPREFSLGDRAELAAMADQIVAVIAREEFAALHVAALP